MIIRSLRQTGWQQQGHFRQTALSTINSLFLVSTFLPFLVSATASGGISETTKHESGRCAIRGHCGKQSFFGGELPCLDNGLAEEPEPEVRAKIVDLCGDKWTSGAVCCLEEQVCGFRSKIARILFHIFSTPCAWTGLSEYQ